MKSEQRPESGSGCGLYAQAEGSRSKALTHYTTLEGARAPAVTESRVKARLIIEEPGEASRSGRVLQATVRKSLEGFQQGKGVTPLALWYHAENRGQECKGGGREATVEAASPVQARDDSTRTRAVTMMW